ncbi:MAG TPA: L,D-transpeptidase family protein [Planctomycetota bacterium]|nr:L,D-transpeptidase family protein [Planctomycetota bacterium]
MKGAVQLLAAAVVGAGVVWAVQGFPGMAPRERAPGADGGGGASGAGEDPSPASELSGGAAAPGGIVPQLSTWRMTAPLASPLGAGGPVDSSGPPPTTAGGEDTAARPEARAAIDRDRGMATAAFDSGDRREGVRLLDALYSLSKDRPDVDLSGEVERLLQVETNLERRRELVGYLARRDRTGRVLEEEVRRAMKLMAAAETDRDAAIGVWDGLSIAYEIAGDRTGRRRVLEQLVPYLKRMVFSGRYTPLLESYMIQSGDSLSVIAGRFQTTGDALKRLNSLNSEVIQPRQRLRVLRGKTKLFVDKSDFVLWATIDGRVFLEFPVGLGRDNATPVGSFGIKVRQKDPTWWRPGKAPVPAGDPENILGTRWLGFEETKDFAGYGIHGTTDPQSLGKESSAGCVRLKNEDIEVLYDFVPYGTEVEIRP